jgi:hypothetical protein
MKSVAMAFGVVLCLIGFSRAQDSLPSKVAANPGSGVAARGVLGEANSEIDPAKEADIRHLLGLLHTDALCDPSHGHDGKDLTAVVV